MTRGKWKSDWDALLGTMPDRRLADQLKVSWLTVRAHRKANNVKSWREQNPASDRHQARIQAMSDEELTAAPMHVVGHGDRRVVEAVRDEIKRREIPTNRQRRLSRIRDVAFAAAIDEAIRINNGSSFGALAELARLFNITRERARQIAERLGKPLKDEEEIPS